MERTKFVNGNSTLDFYKFSLTEELLLFSSLDEKTWGRQKTASTNTYIFRNKRGALGLELLSKWPPLSEKLFIPEV